MRSGGLELNGNVLVIFFIIFVIFLFWGRGNKKVRNITTTTTTTSRRYYSNPPNNILNKPPGTLSLTMVGLIVSTIVLTCFILFTEWQQEVDSYERSRTGDGDITTDIEDFFFVQTSMGFEVGSDLPHYLSPDGPWFWMGYAYGCIAIILGCSAASHRKKNHDLSLKETEQKLRPILRRLAMDPTGVVEGRIRLPPAIPISKAGKKEERMIIFIYAISALMMILTFLSIGSYFNELATEAPTKNWGNNMGPEHDAQAFLLIFILLIFTIACQITVRYLFAEYEGEDDTMLPPLVRTQSEEIEEKRVKSLSDKPATADDVLEALAKEMEAAKAEAAFLREELDETRNKVKGLEVELEEKSVELQSIQEITKDMEKIVEENKTAGDKSLSLTDSVMVGDNLFSGDKIDKQIINDPEAIARAAIEAYREGRKDRGKVELDLD